MPVVNKAVRNIIPAKGKQKEHKCSIIIPSAGEGYRMKSYGPKSLLKLTPDTNIIARQLDIINQVLGKNNEIILITGFEAGKLMNRTPDNLIKIENEKYDTTNVLRSIGIGLRAATTENILVIYGDLVFNKQALNTSFTESKIVIDRSGYMTDNEVGCISDKGKLESIMYDNQENKWGHISFFTGKELKILKTLAWDSSKYSFYGFEAINTIVEKGGKFTLHDDSKIGVMDVDCTNDLISARHFICQENNLL